MKNKGYKKYKTSDVILFSAFYFTKEDAINLTRKIKKQGIYLECEVDNFDKAIAFISTKQLKRILQISKKLTPNKI